MYIFNNETAIVAMSKIYFACNSFPKMKSKWYNVSWSYSSRDIPYNIKRK